MRRSWLLLLRMIGALNVALALLGCYAESIPVMGFLRNPPRFNPREPYFPTAFWTMIAINAVFLAAFIIVGVMLLKLRQGAAIAHTCLVAVAVIYVAGSGPLWLLPNGMGSSIAGANGVADIGLGVLLLYPVPLLYPLISLACVNIARYQLKKAGSDTVSAARYV